MATPDFESIDPTGDISALSFKLDEILKPTLDQKNQYSEITTPYALRRLMLNQIRDREFWSQIKNVFDPCCGKGGFVIDMISRFMDGYWEQMFDPLIRYKFIVENLIYFNDINPDNIAIVKKIIDPTNIYQLHFSCQDALAPLPDSWPPGFDLVIMNPPYNKPGRVQRGSVLYTKFIKQALSCWVRHDIGNFISINPPSWRRPCGDKSLCKGLFQLMTHDNWMKNLSIHDQRDGYKFFNCGTRFDYYHIVASGVVGLTHIKPLTGDDYDYFLDNYNWWPNDYSLDFLCCITGDIKQKMEYSTIRDFKDEPDAIYCKKLVHSTNISGIRYKYGKQTPASGPKVIFGVSGIKNNAVIDSTGELGLTQGAVAIHEPDIRFLSVIKEAIESERFSKIMKICEFSTFGFGKYMFKDFRDQFWTLFIVTPTIN